MQGEAGQAKQDRDLRSNKLWNWQGVSAVVGPTDDDLSFVVDKFGRFVLD